MLPKLSKIANTEKEQFQYIIITNKDYATVTNGHVLIKLDLRQYNIVGLENMRGKAFHFKNFAKFEKQSVVRLVVSDKGVQIEHKGKKENEYIKYDAVEDKTHERRFIKTNEDDVFIYPNHNVIVPKDYEVGKYHHVGMNATNLKLLIDGIGVEMLEFTFIENYMSNADYPEKVIIVKPIDSYYKSRTVGYIMPIRLT